jgi:hypothetical protein
LSGATLATREFRPCLKGLSLLRAFERSGVAFFGSFLAKQKGTPTTVGTTVPSRHSHAKLALSQLNGSRYFLCCPKKVSKDKTAKQFWTAIVGPEGVKPNSLAANVSKLKQPFS